MLAPGRSRRTAPSALVPQPARKRLADRTTITSALAGSRPTCSKTAGSNVQAGTLGDEDGEAVALDQRPCAHRHLHAGEHRPRQAVGPATGCGDGPGQLDRLVVTAVDRRPDGDGERPPDAGRPRLLDSRRVDERDERAEPGPVAQQLPHHRRAVARRSGRRRVGRLADQERPRAALAGTANRLHGRHELGGELVSRLPCLPGEALGGAGGCGIAGGARHGDREADAGHVEPRLRREQRDVGHSGRRSSELVGMAAKPPERAPRRLAPREP